MGYRANVITQHRAYGSQTFGMWENFVYKFVPAMDELGYDISGNENDDFFEMDKKHLQDFVDSLPSNDEQSISSEHTNNELKQQLQWAIDETKDEYVAWEWF